MDDAERAALATSHLDLPRRAAAIIYPRVREYIDLDELVGLGNLGLTEAAGRYDPASGASFRTYAWYRVHGAILDGVRRMANLPRRVWARITALTASAAYLEAAASRATVARDTAGAATTADQLRAVQTALGAIRTMFRVSLDGPAQTIAHPGDGADRALDRAQQATKLHAALARLPERERILLHAHYVDGKTLLDAGAELGMSKSWASRLHARAIDRLRELLDEPD